MGTWIKRLRRGDVVIVATGSGYGSKPRPSLIIQSDILSSKPTVILLGFTSRIEVELDWRPVFEPSEENGLQIRSALMADNPLMVLRSKIDRTVGHLSSAEMSRAESALSIVFALG